MIKYIVLFLNMAIISSCGINAPAEFYRGSEKISFLSLDEIKINDRKLDSINCSNAQFHCTKTRLFTIISPISCPTEDNDKLYDGWNYYNITFNRISLPPHGSDFDGLFASTSKPYTAIEFENDKVISISINTINPNSYNYPARIERFEVKDKTLKSPFDCKKYR